MRVDPAVVHQKYDREIARLQDQRDSLEQRGVFLLNSSSFPFIELLYVPRQRLGMVVPIIQQGFFLPRATAKTFEIPSLSARAVKAHFDLSNYDLDPPGLQFRDPWTDEVLSYNDSFRALQFDPHRKGHHVLLDDHPDTHKPFLCLRGIREYHQHPQHSGDEWLLYRESMNIFSIVMSLWRVSIDLPRPVLVIQGNAYQVQWLVEEKL